MNIYTGNEIVDEVGQMSFTGNIIPPIWFKTIVKPNGKPNSRGIHFLSDIVYWYRPSQKRDEDTGQVTHFEKKFRGDLLQRSYNQLAEQFGCTKGEATSTINELIELGVIERIFKTETRNGICLNNVMYIKLNVSELRRRTFPEIDDTVPDTPPPKKPDSLPLEIEIAVPSDQERVSRNDKIAITENRDTYTETISENSTKTSFKTTQSFYLSPDEAVIGKNAEYDRLSEDELREKVEDDFCDKKEIQYSYRTDGRMLVALKILTDWYDLRPEHFNSVFEKAVFDMFILCLSEMACADGTQTYKGSVISGAKVIEQINDVVRCDGSLYVFMQETIDDYMKAAAKDDIRDKRKYMKSVIWNSFLTYRVKTESDFIRTYQYT